MERAFGVGPGPPPRGGGHVAYSKYLLSGLLRRGICGARIIAQTGIRRKGNQVYRYGWYRCGFAKANSPAICTHQTGYRTDRLEGALPHQVPRSNDARNRRGPYPRRER